METLEKIRILNCLESSNVDNDWTFETAENSGILTAPSQLPRTMDLRAPWWKIADQQQTGSCVGWATADSVLRWHFVKNNQLNKDELLSVRFIWMASKETDVFDSRPSTFIDSSGTSLKSALDIAKNYGCVKENLLPFDNNALYNESENTFYALASSLKIRSYFNLNTEGDKLINWKSWLSQKGPILTRLNVDASFMNASSSNGDLDTYGTYHYGGHAIAIVGYTGNRFIIRNSWGESWGDGGFAYASYDYASKAFTESYGIILFEDPS
ncbi:MAG: hypothetical protein DHS20C18_10780 [Saprospiraceae bacterium]|nr:MAG: hypothetical protein DHS20C18_10780 [Saprospiraceae bacterium]